MDEWVFAIDGGGSKTLTALANRAGNVRMLPVQAGCNAFDNVDWRDALTASFKALASLDIAFSFGIVGLPGYSEVQSVDEAARNVVAGNCRFDYEICNDVAMAFNGAFCGKPGVFVLSGTGSMAMANGPAGSCRAGGWGDTFGDEGSGFWIGREAMARASRALDGRTNELAFARNLLKDLAVRPNAGPHAFLEWLVLQKHPRSAIAGQAMSVDRLAENGDETAREILREAAEYLHDNIVAVRRLSGQKTVEWSFAGSAFNSRKLLEELAKPVGAPPT